MDSVIISAVVGDPFYIERSNSPARSRKRSTHISLIYQTRTIRMSRARGTTLGRRQGGQGRKLLLCRVPLQQPRRPLRRRDRAGQRPLPIIGSNTAAPKFASFVPHSHYSPSLSAGVDRSSSGSSSSLSSTIPPIRFATHLYIVHQP